MVAPRSGVDYLIYARQRERIFGAYLIEVHVVDAHPEFAVGLRDNHRVCQPLRMDHLTDEASLQELRHLLSNEGLTPHFLPDGPRVRPHGEAVLDHLPGDPGHDRRLPCEDVRICPQEGDERAFLFGVQGTVNLGGLGWIIAKGNLLDGHLVGRGEALLGGAGRGGLRDLRLRGCRQVVGTLLRAGEGDLDIAKDGDGAAGARHLHLEVGVVGGGHELHQRGPA